MTHVARNDGAISIFAYRIEEEEEVKEFISSRKQDFQSVN